MVQEDDEDIVDFFSCFFNVFQSRLQTHSLTLSAGELISLSISEWSTRTSHFIIFASTSYPHVLILLWNMQIWIIKPLKILFINTAGNRISTSRHPVHPALLLGWPLGWMGPSCLLGLLASLAPAASSGEPPNEPAQLWQEKVSTISTAALCSQNLMDRYNSDM